MMSSKSDAEEICVEISDMPDSFTEDLCLLFLLENKYAGCGKFEIRDFNIRSKTATVLVKDKSIAEKILEGNYLDWEGKKMQLKEVSTSKEIYLIPKESFRPLKTVQLIGDFKNINKIYLELYLENRGDYEEFIFGECGPLVTFKDARVAKTFSSTSHELNGIKFKAMLIENWPATDSSCGIEIFCSECDESFIKLMLESHRYGGEYKCIEELYIDKDNRKRTVATLRSHAVVEAIMQKTNGSIRVESKVYTIKPLRPAKPPMFVENPDEKKLLFLELDVCALDIKKFEKFVTECSKASIQQLFFSPKVDRVLVQFMDFPDYENVLNVLCHKPFDGIMLSVQRVLKTKSIQVMDCNFSKDHLTLYFEKCGEGKVQEVHEYDLEGIVVITFENCCDAERVLLQDHSFSVAPFLEEFGIIPKGFDHHKPPSKIPESTTCPISREVYGFLYENEQYKKDIEFDLRKKDCSVSWPTSPENLDIKLTWIGSHAFSSSWSTDVLNCFEKRIAAYEYIKKEIPGSLFDFAASKAKRYKPGKDKLLTRIEKNSNTIFAVGLKNEIENLRGIIKKSQTIQSVSVKLKPHEYSLTTKSHSFKEMEKMFMITVLAEKEKSLLLLKGQVENVTNCQLHIEEQKRKIEEDEINWLGSDQRILNFFRSKEVLERVEKEFCSKGIVAVMQVDIDSLMIYSFDHLEKGRDYSKLMFKKLDIHLDDAKQEFTRSMEWMKFVDDLMSKLTFVCFLDGNNLCVFSFSKEVDETKKILMGFLDENSKKIELLQESLSTIVFLTKQSKEFIEIITKAKSVGVEVNDLSNTKSGFQLIGKKSDVATILKELTNLCSKVKRKSYHMDGKVKILFSPYSSNLLSGICSNKQVHIAVKDLLKSEIQKHIHATKRNSSSPKIRCFSGSIVDQQTDVVFNCCTHNLELQHSAISKAFMSRVGPRLQEELKTKLLSKKLHPGEIIETPGYNLKCSYIYHGFCTPWNKNKLESEKTLRMLIKNSLEKASQDNKSSISFPAFGTGKLGVPHHLVARMMLDEAFSFSSQSSSLKEINFVIFENDSSTLQAFKDEMDSLSHSFEEDDDSNPGSTDVDGTLLELGGCSLMAIKKDLIAEKCDAIINSTNRTFDTEGGCLSHTIMEKAGEEVKSECTKIGTLRDGWAMTGSGNLSSCDFIFHVTGKSLEDWEKVIVSILREANKKKLASIAMPLLGTGHQKIKVEEMAGVFIKCFKKMLTFQDLSVRLLKIMIPSDSMFSKFVESVRTLKSEGERISSPSTKRKDENKVEIEICGMRIESIEEAHKEIKCELQKVITEKEIECPLKIISLDLFKSVCTKHGIHIELKNNKTIKIKGESDISAAIGEVTEILNKEMKKQFEMNEMKNIANYVIWSYSDESGKDVEFGLYSNSLLESALQKKETSICWTDSKKKKHKVDFSQMKDTVDGKDYAVHRKTKGSIALPSIWEKMSETEVVKLVSLNKTSKEFLDILKHFHAGSLKPNILKIERIQNPSLYRQYISKKQDFELKKKGTEAKVWHGTSPSNINNINTYNFNRSFGNQGSYGVGVYFATNPDYSIQSYCPPSNTGEKTIYLASVLPGNVGRGSAGLREPPISNQVTGERYDSVSDRTPAGMYVIFYDSQMYPEYLITFM